MIEVNNVSKYYYLFEKDMNAIKWLLTNKTKAPKKCVLNNISFKVDKGEILGIIGKNGAGKSTLLKIIQSTTYPNEGTITVNGTIGSFINLGAGFFPEYTGRENVYYKSMLMGKSKRFVNGIIEDIIDFADVGDYFDMPLKTYSSGMTARLGFSVSVFNNPDIILLDEVFSVGDRNFKEKSGKKMMELLSSGKTVILTSHNENQIKEFCTRVIYIANGKITYDGNVNDAIELYNKE